MLSFLSCSGITLTKLVGVIVLAFARSQVFVVCDSLLCFHHCYKLLIETFCCLINLHAFTGLLLPDVSRSSYPWFPARSNIFTCKLSSPLNALQSNLFSEMILTWTLIWNYKLFNNVTNLLFLHLVSYPNLSGLAIEHIFIFSWAYLANFYCFRIS